MVSYREFKLPKKGKGFRLICAPSKTLKILQRKSLRELYEFHTEAVKGTIIENVQHGFLRMKSPVTGAKRHIGYKTTIMLDLSDFFNTITEDMIPCIIQKDIYFHKEGRYTAQGFVTSPILANIASIPFLTDIESFLISNYKEHAMVSYADDLSISINSEDYTDSKRIIDYIEDAARRFRFKVNTKKTRIKYAKFGYRRILGINVGDDHIRATRKVMQKIRAAHHQEAWRSLGGLTAWSKCSPPKVKHYDKA